MNTFAGAGRLKSAFLAVVLIAAMAACGGGGGGGGDSGTTAVSSGGTTVPISNLDASTYMIGITTVGPRGQRTTIHATGFAVGDNLIATNAHVTQGVLDNARALAAGQEKITAVTAYQSETGRAFPLLTAVTHPSYNGDTRSPDVGLFVSREVLPAKLALDDPQSTTRLRKGDPMQLNGFPGVLFDQVYPNFQPGLSVPKAQLFSCNIQTIEAFDSRKVVDPTNISTIEMYFHGCDTSGGTSGSPILNSGKVFALHNAGITLRFQVPNAQGQQQLIQVPLAVGSWAVHVKHLHNLIALNQTGVIEADKRFDLPPSDALVASRATGGQAAGPTGTGSSYRGTVSNASNANVTHQVQLSVASNLAVTGTSSWPANAARNLAARTFVLKGVAQADGRIEFSDNTPEVVPGFRRGVYTGVLNGANGVFTGEYFELNAATNELFYFGDWTAKR